LTRLEDVRPAPEVSFQGLPASIDGDELPVKLKLVDQGGGIGQIRLYVNGTAVVLDAGRGLEVLPRAAQGVLRREFRVRLAGGANELKALAHNGDNTMEGMEAVATVTARVATPRGPDLHALVVGINEYENSRLDLNYAVADAELFAATLEKGASGLFGEVKVKLLRSKAETARAGLARALREMQTINPGDLFVLFVAGHGVVRQGKYFLLTSDVGSTSIHKLEKTALGQEQFKELVANVPATKKLIVLDTCGAEAMGDALQVALAARGMNEDTAIRLLSRAVGSTILCAATTAQQALEGFRGHGIFTWVLARGLAGDADADGDGFVKNLELANYLEDEVPALAEQEFQRKQYPIISVTGTGIPIGRTMK